ncbi:MAG: ATP-binding protein [Candidatus Polarisedimenticolaceae bacterium]|nr:ATP-binding protein [Candidatus Polarisedimenticolaceae bacterium]
MLEKLFSGFFARTFWSFSVFVLTLSAFFTLIHISRQSELLNQDLTARGLSYAENMATASELGVFSENPYFLLPMVKKILQEADVVFAAVYTASGQLLVTETKGDRFAIKNEVDAVDLNRLLDEKSSFNARRWLKDIEVIEFWAPVIVSKRVTDEDIFLDSDFLEEGDAEELADVGRVIGVVLVRLSQDRIATRLNDLMMTNLSITLFFLPIALLITYFMARSITGPILKLNEGVHNLEQGGHFEPIDVSDTNEIGDLAASFNQMASSLKRKDAEIMKNMQRLSALNHIASVVSRSLDIKQILQDALVELLNVTSMDAAWVCLRSSESGKMALVAAQPIDNPRVVRDELIAISKHMEETEQVAGDAVIIEDASKDVALELKNCAGSFRGLVCIPLISQNNLADGVIYIASFEQYEFAEDELDLLFAIRDEIGLAVQNSILYEQLKEQLQETKNAQFQLISSARLASIGELAANVAHEVNNPLTGILTHTCLLRDGREWEESDKRRLDIVYNETMRIRKIVRNLLDFSRQGETERSTTDLNEVVKETIELVSHHAESANIKIEDNCVDRLPLLYLDSTQIKQVFLNIINNAVYAMTGGGVIKVTSSANDAYVQVDISDNGPGIPAHVLAKIFDPFFTTKPETKGTGLGLSVSLGIIKEHDGVIEVDTTEGKGTTFTIRFPMSKENLPIS